MHLFKSLADLLLLPLYVLYGSLNVTVNTDIFAPLNVLAHTLGNIFAQLNINTIYHYFKLFLYHFIFHAHHIFLHLGPLQYA